MTLRGEENGFGMKSSEAVFGGNEQEIAERRSGCLFSSLYLYS